MPAEPDLIACVDYRTIELRVIAFMMDDSFEQQQAINRRERTVKLLSRSPTGCRCSEPEMQRLTSRSGVPK